MKNKYKKYISAIAGLTISYNLIAGCFIQSDPPECPTSTTFQGISCTLNVGTTNYRMVKGAAEGVSGNSSYYMDADDCSYECPGYGTHHNHPGAIVDTSSSACKGV